MKKILIIFLTVLSTAIYSQLDNENLFFDTPLNESKMIAPAQISEISEIEDLFGIPIYFEEKIIENSNYGSSSYFFDYDDFRLTYIGSPTSGKYLRYSYSFYSQMEFSMGIKFGMSEKELFTIFGNKSKTDLDEYIYYYSYSPHHGFANLNFIFDKKNNVLAGIDIYSDIGPL